MSQIDVNIDQLNNIYSDGLNNYREAVKNFAEGATISGKVVQFFMTEHIEKYFPDAQQMSSDVLALTLDSTTLLNGYEAFSNKIAQLLMNLAQIDDTLNLDDYPDLQDNFNAILASGVDITDFDNFDKINTQKYSDWLQAYDDILANREQIMKDLEGIDQITVDELREKLLAAGYKNEEIDQIISTFGVQEDGKTIKVVAGLTAALAFTLSLASKHADIAGSVAGDTYFNFTDTPAWLLNTPLAKIYETMTTSGLAGGVLASLTVGTVLAFQDGEFDMETWLEEGFSAAVGSVAGNLAVAALGLTGGLAVLAGVAISTGVTIAVSAIIDSIYNMPGGVPFDFDSWSEEEQIKYIYENTGIDLKKVEEVRKLYESGLISPDDARSIYQYCGDESIADDSSYDNPAVIAFTIYNQYKGNFDSSENIYECAEYITAGMNRYDKAYEYISYDDIYHYIEKYKAVLK